MKGWFTTDVLSPLDAPPATPAVCQEHHHGTVGRALVPRREASPRSPDVKSNHFNETGYNCMSHLSQK